MDAVIELTPIRENHSVFLSITKDRSASCVLKQLFI